jgi:ornithine--oxo-acid transaminase
VTFSLRDLIESRQGENLALHSRHINPQFARVLKTIGFDRVYVRASGAYLYDQEGNQYLDFLAGYGMFNIGRNHPKVRSVLKEYLEEELPSLVQLEAPLLSGLLAEKLKSLVPSSLDTVYFTNSGTEGMETAIKFVRCATRRPRILHCEHSFHGLTNGALSLNGEPWFRDGFDPLLPGCEAIPLGDIEALRRELVRGDVGAFVVEPVQGKGVFIAPDEYLLQAAKLCREHGALFVLDEVQTGFGRTGKLFAREYSGVVPDIMIVSKSLSGGFVPVGAVLTRRAIYDKVFSCMERSVVHSSTFGQGAFAMAAALATLSVIEEEDLVGNAERMGKLLREGLRDLAGRYELIREVRGRGLMIAIEFGRPRSFKLKMGWDLAHKVNAGLFPQAIIIPLLEDHHILTQVAGHDMDVIKLLPPLVITEGDVARFLEAFEVVLQRSHKFPGPIWEVASRLTKFAMKR